LTGFGHVQRRPAMAQVRKSLATKVDGPTRGRSRPKKDMDGGSKNRSKDVQLI